MELNKTISELRRMALTAGILLTASSAPAQSLDEARTLAEDGNIADAITMLLQIEADEPKNAEIPQLLGDLYLGTGRDDDARSPPTNRETCQTASTALRTCSTGLSRLKS